MQSFWDVPIILCKGCNSRSDGKYGGIFDGGAGVARETRRRLMEKELLYTGDRKGRVIFENSAATLEKLRLCEILLNSK